jgi:prevent-host-death family protein
MFVFDAAEAELNFDHLLDLVEKGENVMITRHGRDVARLVISSSTLTKTDDQDESQS